MKRRKFLKAGAATGAFCLLGVEAFGDPVQRVTEDNMRAAMQLYVSDSAFRCHDYTESDFNGNLVLCHGDGEWTRTFEQYQAWRNGLLERCGPLAEKTEELIKDRVAENLKNRYRKVPWDDEPFKLWADVVKDLGDRK